MMGKLIGFLTSVKTAVALILVLILLSVLSTLVPQGMDDGYYRDRYSPGLYGILTATGLNRFSTSPLFLVPSGLFVASLGLCTADRMLRRLKAKAAPRHGPDLIHIGILVLVIGGLSTTILRTETAFTLAAGQQVELPGGRGLTLLSFEFLRYEDGRPRSWTSTVRARIGDRVVAESRAIEVNRPLRLGSLVVYQTGYGGVARLEDPAGTAAAMTTGQWIEAGDSALVLASIERNAPGSGEFHALVEEWRGETLVSSTRVPRGGSIGSYRIVDLTEFSGLRAVEDPGFLPVLLALGIISIGLVITLVQKREGRRP